VLLLLTIVAFSVLIGLLVGGRLRRFEYLKVRWWGLAIVGVALQVVPVPDLSRETEETVGFVLLLGSYLALLLMAAVNLRTAGFPLILIGIAMNVLVISANSGMPVTESALVRSGQVDTLRQLKEEGGTKHHLADPDEDVLLFLADVIPVGGPFRQAISAGDLVLYSGVMWLVISVMRGRSRGLRPPPLYWVSAAPRPVRPPEATTSRTEP
jgi:hypothetical protein